MKPKVECVISGISGRFPAADSMEEFEYKLFNKIDMVTEDDSRWKPGLFNLPRRNGKIRSIDKFDSDYFNVPDNIVEYVDPQDRIFLELVVEAAADAGLQLEDIAGERTGFYWGSCFADLHRDFDDPYRVPGISHAMARRITHYFDIRGPTVHTDTACNSSLNAMNEAFLAIKTGLLDRAIVGGSNTCFRPLVSQRFRDLTMISKDGTCKCLDESADGYCRSEAIVIVLLERKDVAKRIYAKILNSKSGSDGFKEEGITFPSMVSQRRLAQITYEEANINPAEIGYIEAHVTGTAAGDPVEMQAMYDVICSKRTSPVLIGCVKSSVGHAEGGSGLCSVAKALIVLQKRLIPPNIHYSKPNPNIKGLLDGSMVSVTETTALPGKIIPVNSFGFGGANTHVVLEGYFEGRKFGPLHHRLINVCGRTIDAVNHIVQALIENKSYQTPDFLSLMDNYSKYQKMNFKGYLLLSGDRVLHKSVSEVTSTRTCLVFSNWISNGKSEASFDDLESFHAIKKLIQSKGNVPDAMAIQMTWAILLKQMGLKFDKIMGIGTGKIACSVMKGHLSIEDAVALVSEVERMNDSKTRLNGEMNGFFVVIADQNGLHRYGSIAYGETKLDWSLRTLGELYKTGMSMDISVLYPGVKYPLPSSTPTFSSLIKWDHSKTFPLTPYLVQNTSYQKSQNFKYHFSRRNPDDSFLYDHKIDERILFPATGYLMIAWVTLSKLTSQNIFDMPVQFSNVIFSRATVLQKASETSLSVMLNEGNGNFTVSDGDNVVVSGKIKRWDDEMPTCSAITSDSYQKSDDLTTLTANQIYKEFRVRGYDYGQFFQGLFDCSADGYKGNLIWRDVVTKSVRESMALETEDESSRLWIRSWVSFVDAMFQLDILNQQNDSRSLFVPTRVDSIICSPEIMIQNIEESRKFLDPLTLDQSSIIPTYRDFGNIIFTKGLIVKGLKTTLLKRKPQQPSVFNWGFKPFFGQTVLTKNTSSMLQDYLKVCLAAHQNLPCGHNFDLNDKRFVLLKNLTQKTNDPLSTDIILTRFEMKHEFLYPLLDSVITSLQLSQESDNPFDVLEINASSHILGKEIMDFWPSILLFDIIKLNYTLLHPNPDDLSTGYPENLKVKSGTAIEIAKKQHLILLNYCDNGTKEHFEFNATIESAFKTLHDSGWLMVIFNDDSNHCSSSASLLRKYASNRHFSRTEEIISYAEKIGFRTIRDLKVDGCLTQKALLFRKIEANVDHLTHRVIEVGLDDYDNWFEDLKLFLREENEYKDKRIWIVPKITDGKNRATGIVGLVKSLRLEEGGERLRTLIDYSVEKIEIMNPKYRDILKNDMIHNVFDPESQTWGFFQLMFYPTAKTDFPTTKISDAYLRCLKPGDLTTLTWVQDKFQDEHISSENQLINVAYSALNFRDIMFATGQLDSDAIPGIHPDIVQDSIMGLEFSGIDQENNRVMGIIPYRGMATKIITERDNDFVWSVPNHWTLEEAATVPVVYATAYYALVVRGNLTPGESVLIHSGCGGVGLAAIKICLSMNCQVYATCGSDKKKQYLLDRFPQLENRIFNSRDVSFEEHILRATSGTGVDAILNSLSEDKMKASIRCLAVNGRFLEIGKVDFVKDNSLLLHQVTENKSFHGILLDALFQYNKDVAPTKKIFDDKKRLRNLLTQGIKDGIVEPLDATIFTSNDVENAFRFMASGKHIGKVLIKIRDENFNSSIASMKSTYFYANKSYIVLGGLGGFGMEMVNFLALRGAKNIVISSRSGVRDSYQRYSITRLNRKGVNVLVCTADITTEAGCKQLIEDTMSQTKLPIGGIFNIAVVYKDILYQDQYVSQFREVCGPKSEASKHLDLLSRKLCPQLDYFVTFSSISANRGNAGQTNYNFANSAMDSICLERRRIGYPGLSIQWGVVGDVGIVAETSHGNDMVLLGSRAQRMHSCFEMIDMFMQGESAVCLSFIRADPESNAKGNDESGDILSVVTRLLGLKDMTNLDPEITLGGLGVDSLIAVEIKQALDKCSGTSISIKDVRNLTISTLVNMTTQPSSPGTTETPAAS